jgi:hypothetical protein
VNVFVVAETSWRIGNQLIKINKSSRQDYNAIGTKQDGLETISLLLWALSRHEPFISSQKLLSFCCPLGNTCTTAHTVQLSALSVESKTKNTVFCLIVESKTKNTVFCLRSEVDMASSWKDIEEPGQRPETMSCPYQPT